MDLLSDYPYIPRKRLSDYRMSVCPKRYTDYFISEGGIYDAPSLFNNGIVTNGLTTLMTEQERLKRRARQIKDLEREMEEHIVMYKEHYGIGGKLRTRYADLQFRIIQMKNENKDLQRVIHDKMEKYLCTGNDVTIGTNYEFQEEKTPDSYSDDVKFPCSTRWAKLERMITEFDTDQKRKFQEFHDKYTRKMHLRTDTKQGDEDFNWYWHSQDLILSSNKDIDEPKDKLYADRILHRQDISIKESFVCDGNEELVKDHVSLGNGMLYCEEKLTDTGTHQTEGNEELHQNEEEFACNSRSNSDTESTEDDHTHVFKKDESDTCNSACEASDANGLDLERTNLKTDIKITGEVRQECKNQLLKKRRKSPRNPTHEELGKQIVEGLKRNLHERFNPGYTSRPGSVLTRTGRFRSQSGSNEHQFVDGNFEQLYPEALSPRRGRSNMASKDDMFQKRLDEMAGLKCVSDRGVYPRKSYPSDHLKQRRMEKYLYTDEKREDILKDVKRCFIKEVPFCIYSNYQRRPRVVRR